MTIMRAVNEAAMTAEDGAVTRGAGVALWRQIADRLRAEIAAGSFAVGARLPTEAALAERFGVNRLTLRRAVETLVRDGLIVTRQGSGAFVRARPIAYPITSRTRFSEILGRAGLRPAGRILRVEAVAADPHTAALLEVADGAALWRAETVREVEGRPVSWDVVAVAQARAPRFDRDLLETASVTAALTAAGHADYRRKETRISAGFADAQDAARIAVAVGDPVLIVESVNVDAQGAPLQTGCARFDAAGFELVVSQDFT